RSPTHPSSPTGSPPPRAPPSLPTRRSSDLQARRLLPQLVGAAREGPRRAGAGRELEGRRRRGQHRRRCAGRGPGRRGRGTRMSEWTDSRPARTPGMSAKEEDLARVRTALAAPRSDEVTEAEDVPRTYQRADDKQEVRTAPEKVRGVLVQRLEDYTATVHRATAATAPAAVAAALDGARSVIVPSGVPASWCARTEADVVTDDGTAAPHELAAIDAVLTGCHTAIALTGTIVLRHDDLGGRRAISLVPDRHVVVVEAEQVVLGVPKAIQRMGED